MFRKDNMFKKLQMRFFSFIISILLAVFIALLVSINVIMEAVLQRESKVVLRQIASSIEYDEKNSTFTYYPPHDNQNLPPKEKFPEKDRPEDDRIPPHEGYTSKSDAAAEQTTQPTTEDPPQTTSQEESASASKTTAAGEAPSTEKNTSPTSAATKNTDRDVPANAQTATTAKPTDAADKPQTNTAPSTGKIPQSTAPAHSENKVETTETTTVPNQFPPFTHPDDWQHGGHNFDHGRDEPWGEHDFQKPTFPPYSDDWQKYGSDQFGFNMPGVFSDEPAETTEAGQLCHTGNGGAVMQLSGAIYAPVLAGYSVLASSEPIFPDDDKTVDKKKSEPIPKSFGSIDFFVLMADESGNFLASLNNTDLDSDTAQDYIDAVFHDGAASGMLGSLQFCTLDKDNGTIIVFTDKSAERDMLRQLSRTTILIGAICFVILAAIAYFLAKKSVEPVKIAFDKQKQFISDASHELKTPLTIISANADVLSDEIGDNKWLAYIQSQAERMNVLVNDLLSLTRLENNTAEFICCEFDLSKAIENMALPFECRAFEENRRLEIDIQPDLTICGSEKHIKQMTAIFIDNALKYSDENGTVRVSLREQGDKKLLSVFNTGSGIKEAEKTKIFERFFRSDDSRCRSTGGYGLGLAIAKSIIDKHRFKITIDNHEGESICFNIIM